MFVPSSQVTQKCGVTCPCPACCCTLTGCCPKGKAMNNLHSRILLGCCPVLGQQVWPHSLLLSFAADSCSLGMHLCPLCSVGYAQSFPSPDFSFHTLHCNLCLGSLPNDCIISSIFICSRLFISRRIILAALHTTNWAAEPSPQTLTEKARGAGLCTTTIVVTLTRATTPGPRQHPDCHPAAPPNAAQRGAGWPYGLRQLGRMRLHL